MTTVVIAAHNEASVIGATLDALLGDAEPGEFEVIVSANGCTDATVQVSESQAGVRVVDSPVPGKAAALNRAEDVTDGFPRLYLDADIPATAAVVRALCAALDGPGAALVAVPSRHLDVTGRPLLVRAYFAVQRHLPAFEDGLFGRGLVALSRQGRERFEAFPEIVADDLFLDSLFASHERVCVAGVTTSIATPLTTRDLVARLVRVRRGNSALRARSAAGDLPARGAVRGSDRLSFLRDVVAPRPWLAPAALVYAGLTLVAELKARRGPLQSTEWGRDESTRRGVEVRP